MERMLRICFYTPFKPLGHENPSGDLVIAGGLYDFLSGRGHHVWPVSSMRSRWIFWKPWLWPRVVLERRRISRKIRSFRPDLWFTYHSYYKAPDLLGSFISPRAKIPYIVFQGIYSTKRRKNLKTWPGYLINKKTLRSADHVFTNRVEDLINLRRIKDKNRLTFVAPGIYPQDFSFDARARDELRRSWNTGNEPVVLSAAMFRPGVKTEGLEWVIRSCGKLFRRGRRFHLVIAGDGKEKARLQKLAETELPGKVRFTGKISRNRMNRFYSAGDLFAFPGIRESLGMVFLEAQSCGIPVVAFANGGIPEVVKDRETGFLVPLYASDPFVQSIEKLLVNRDLRRNMGQAASSYVRTRHDLNRNYQKMETVIENLSTHVLRLPCVE